MDKSDEKRARRTRSRILIVLIAIIVALVVGWLIYWEATHGNRQLVDLKNRFNYAIIRLPNGEVVEGRVTSWLDYDDSDVVQIKIEGRTYLTHYSNVCLIDD